MASSLESMKNYLFPAHHDLVSPDGFVTCINPLDKSTSEVELQIQGISPAFIGFHLEKEHLSFNLKSTLAQLGLHAILKELELNEVEHTARVRIALKAYGRIAQALLSHIKCKAYIGKLFAADPRRRVRNADYLMRMFGRTDRQGSPLLSLGGPKGRDDLLLDKIDGRTVALLRLQEGVLSYDEKAVLGLLPTVEKALLHPHFRLRTLIQLDQIWKSGEKRVIHEQDILLVRTAPLHIRTAFGKVVDALLPPGVHHTSANVLEPDTAASGDVYELYGEAGIEVSVIPIEFYTLEPHREHVFFADRDQLQTCLEDPKTLFSAFQTAPEPQSSRASTFVFKGQQLLQLESDDWIAHKTHKSELPGLFYPTQQSFLVQRYIEQQTEYPFLKSIEDGLITSQGILLTRYFPSPLMKRLLLSNLVQRCLKGIYFHRPSLTWGDFFSHEDRSLLLDLSKFGIPVYWVDAGSGRVLQYVPKPGKDAGMFVPLPMVDTFVKATAFGIYGSTLIQGDFEEQLTLLLRGIIEMRPDCNHALLNPDTPIALVTGGGPGLMEVGNRVAERVGILSCANIVDFRNSDNLNIQEQKQNPYIEAKMTYRLDRLVERQSEFNLDFPIILTGGYGTDFEQALEEVRRKVGSMRPTPVLLFGEQGYWKEKISSRFQCNSKTKTILGSEWVSNCFYCVQTAEQGLKVYKQFFSHTLPIGPHHPGHKEGFTLAY
jgi:predicted Rossmann-fold nucleotide-binding protein